MKTGCCQKKLLEDEQPEREKILEFQKIMERLIAQELHMKKEGEDHCLVAWLKVLEAPCYTPALIEEGLFV